MQKQCRIKHFPVSFFSVILGLAGFSIAVEKMQEIFKLDLNISIFPVVFTTAIFTILSVVYLIKIARFPKAIIEEFNHPVKINFFPTVSIGLLLMSISYLPINLTISKYMWIVGTVLHLFLTLKIISTWIEKSHFETPHMNPSWFIPAVGNILVPVAGIKFLQGDLLWFFFSIGLMFWIILLIIFFNRIIFHKPLPQKLIPTLFILIAPPAVGFISYVKLTGLLDPFAKILYFFALFLTILLLTQVKKYVKIKFYLSWWAYSFPLSSISIASVLMYSKTHTLIYKYVAAGLFALLTILITWLLVRTYNAVIRKHICIEED